MIDANTTVARERNKSLAPVMIHVYREIVTRTMLIQTHYTCIENPNARSLTLQNQSAGLTRIGTEHSDEIVDAKHGKQGTKAVYGGKVTHLASEASRRFSF